MKQHAHALNAITLSEDMQNRIAAEGLDEHAVRTATNGFFACLNYCWPTGQDATTIAGHSRLSIKKNIQKFLLAEPMLVDFYAYEKSSGKSLFMKQATGPLDAYWEQMLACGFDPYAVHDMDAYALWTTRGNLQADMLAATMLDGETLVKSSRFLEKVLHKPICEKVARTITDPQTRATYFAYLTRQNTVLANALLGAGWTAPTEMSERDFCHLYPKANRYPIEEYGHPIFAHWLEARAEKRAEASKLSVFKQDYAQQQAMGNDTLEQLYSEGEAVCEALRDGTRCPSDLCPEEMLRLGNVGERGLVALLQPRAWRGKSLEELNAFIERMPAPIKARTEYMQAIARNAIQPHQRNTEWGR